MMTNASPAPDKGDPYTWNDYAKDLSNGAIGIVGAAGALTTGAGLCISSSSLATVGSITGGIGALQFAFKAVKKTCKRGAIKMLDWLNFFPFAWRDDRKPTEIRGPYFPLLRPNKWFLKDSLIQFSAPKSNPILGFSGRSWSVDAQDPGAANILEAEWERIGGGAEGAPYFTSMVM